MFAEDHIIPHMNDVHGVILVILLEELKDF